MKSPMSHTDAIAWLTDYILGVSEYEYFSNRSSAIRAAAAMATLTGKRWRINSINEMNQPTKYFLSPTKPLK